MKLGAMISRGTRRDFVDLYLLCRELPLAAALARADEKFGHVGDFALQAWKALADPLRGRGRADAAARAGRRDARLGTTSSAGRRRGGASACDAALGARELLAMTDEHDAPRPADHEPRRDRDADRLDARAPAPTQGAVARIDGGEILCRDGRIAFVGPRGERERLLRRAARTRRASTAGGGTAVPGFVDAHTHLPWAGTREDEFVERLGRALLPGDRRRRRRHPLDRALDARGDARRAGRARCSRRLDWMLSCGTTTAEAKSGYGLTLADELKQLEAIRAAAAAPSGRARADAPRRARDAARAPRRPRALAST